MSDEFIRYDLEGADELIEYFKLLGIEVNNHLAGVVLAGGEYLKDEIAILAPGDGIAVQLIEDKPGIAVVAIGPDQEHWYYRLFETGAASHEIKPDQKKALQLADYSFKMIVVNHPGVPATPFMRPATDSKKNKVFEVIADYLRKLISRAQSGAWLGK